MITCISFSFSLKDMNTSLLLFRTNFEVLCTVLMFYKENTSSYWAPLVHMLKGVSTLSPPWPGLCEMGIPETFHALGGFEDLCGQ